MKKISWDEFRAMPDGVLFSDRTILCRRGKILDVEWGTFMYRIMSNPLAPEYEWNVNHMTCSNGIRILEAEDIEALRAMLPVQIDISSFLDPVDALIAKFCPPLPSVAHDHK